MPNRKPITNPYFFPVEDFPQGYPRYSALIASDSTFNIVRRFSHVRTRLLLLKQDRVALLEERLQKIDVEEKAVLFLGNSRSDRNTERVKVLRELGIALKEYGTYGVTCTGSIPCIAVRCQRNLI